MTHELDFLRAENAHLIALLESHNIEWQLPQTQSLAPETNSSAGGDYLTRTRVGSIYDQPIVVLAPNGYYDESHL